MPSVVEICAGAGGQSLGLELAGFTHTAAIDIDREACQTLRTNRPAWNVVEADVAKIDARDFTGADLLAGGVPCPPFSIAGKQLGAQDERDLFPQAVRFAKEIRPRAILLENVRGFATPRFASYRARLSAQLENLGYQVIWRVLDAVDFGVPQYRTRFVLVALQGDDAGRFAWPERGRPALTVGQSIVDLMAARGWPGAHSWAERANGLAPTIVGGSKKHGGPDLGPTRARAEWRRLQVDGKGVAEAAPDRSFPMDHVPRLTVRMVARLQSFPDTWQFVGKKTSSYKQVGNAFPPPVAMAVGLAILAAFEGQAKHLRRQRLVGHASSA